MTDKHGCEVFNNRQNTKSHVLVTFLSGQHGNTFAHVVHGMYSSEGQTGAAVKDLLTSKTEILQKPDRRRAQSSSNFLFKGHVGNTSLSRVLINVPLIIYSDPSIPCLYSLGDIVKTGKQDSVISIL